GGTRCLTGLRHILDQVAGGVLWGQFHPGPGFAAVAPLFRAFEEAADQQALARVDELGRSIAALHLQLTPPGGGEAVAVHDVQIWSDGGGACRLPETRGTPWQR